MASHGDDLFDDIDGCDLDLTVDPTPDDETDLFVLFAEAFDPLAAKTVELVEAEWRELFDAPA